MIPADNNSEHSYSDNLSESFTGLSVGGYGVTPVTQHDTVTVANNNGHHSGGNLSVLGEGLELNWGSGGGGVNIA